MNKIDKEDALDLFQHWLIDMPKAIERLMHRLPSEMQEKLDYSIRAIALQIDFSYILINYSPFTDVITNFRSQITKTRDI